MSIIIPANTLAAGGFDVDNSLRFERGSNDHLTRTMVAATLATKFTYSFWIKRGLLTSGTHTLFESYEDDNNRFLIFLHPGDDLRLLDLTGGSTQMDIRTNRLFRDPSAWMHIVCAVDTTQGTAGNRTKIYVNGVQESSFSTNTTFDQNDTPEQGTTDHAHTIGKYGGGTGDNYSGYMSEAVFIDGLQLAADQFGEFDEDSGIWKPIKVSGLTFGDNGFYLQFEQAGTSQNSSGMGADTSGEDNHFAVNNLTAVDQSLDTCTNNFATWNPLFRKGTTTPAFTEGNLKSTFDDTGANEFALTTFGVSAGKWYAEVKWTANTGTAATATGILDMAYSGTADPNDAVTNAFGYFGSGTKNVSGTASSYGNSYADGNIVGIAIDMDNNKLYFSKNGTFQNSGDPTTGATGTGAIAIVAGVTYGIFATDYNNQVAELNTGSPAFSGTDKADGNGFGSFEYEPPSGYLAICTKNLAENG